MNTPQKPIAITMGDPSGIGPEIIAKTLLKPEHRLSSIIVGDPLVMRHAFAQLSDDLKVHELESIHERILDERTINLITSSRLPALPAAGFINAQSGQAAYDAITHAVHLAKHKEISGIVTAPIHKEALNAAGQPYPGHTEILAAHSGSSRVAMMLANDDICTVLVTIHCSLKEAIQAGDFQAQISAIRLAHEAGLTMGIKAPRIAVAGLNPHAGEGGLFGDEEIRFITPAIKQAKTEGIDVSGPWPGDTVFMQARKGQFDIVVAQYHDQGLIPVKYLGIEQGVNVTLGLPFIRTSPDHGTAFDIAGQGIADASSLEYALKYALRLSVSSPN